MYDGAGRRTPAACRAVNSKSAPGRRTRQRILDTTLALYNERGEPQVSTSLIATELGISAGNLHYHFRRKDQLSAALLEQFVAEFDAQLPPPNWRADNVEDVWLLLHVLLETLSRYRFLFRDLSGIMSRDRRAGQRLATTVFERSVERLARHLPWTRRTRRLDCDGGRNRGAGGEHRGRCRFTGSHLIRHGIRETIPLLRTGMSRGVYQVLMLVAPFLQPESRFHLERLAEGYLARR